MATERQIPGSAFVNETATKQRQIPGGAYVNETVSAATPAGGWLNRGYWWSQTYGNLAR